MQKAQSRKLLEILDRTVSLSPSKRVAYVESVCGNDVDLKSKILKALSTDQTIAPHREAEAPMPEIPDSGDFDTRYRLEENIASGGMGNVSRAHDLKLDRRVAIKVLSAEHKGNSQLVSRFVAEAKLAGNLAHPGIAPIYDFGIRDDGLPYIAMKLIEGFTLAQIIKDSWEGETAHRLTDIFLKTAQAIAYAHSKCIVHRDIKPENIMVSRFGEIQVMDWGIAKQISETSETAVANIDEQANNSISHRTRIGTAMGTPAYMAPEQALGVCSYRTDVFSLGALLCEILTGKPPYVGSTSTACLEKAVQGNLEDAIGRLKGCGASDSLVELAVKCLSPDPTNRPADAAAVAEWVESYLRNFHERLRAAEMERQKALVRAAEEKKRSRLKRIAAIVALILTGFIASALVYNVKESLRHANEVAVVERERRVDAEKANYWATVLTAPQIENNWERYQMLQQAPMEQRNWEWHHQMADVDQRFWTYDIEGTEHFIPWAAGFIEGGDEIGLLTIGTNSQDGVFHIINRDERLRTETPLHALGQPLAVNAGLTRLLTIRADHKAFEFWELPSGRRIRSFPTPERISKGTINLNLALARNRYAVSPDGRYVLVFEEMNQSKLYDVNKVGPIQTFESGHGKASTFTDDGTGLVYSHGGGTSVWGLENSQHLGVNVAPFGEGLGYSTASGAFLSQRFGKLSIGRLSQTSDYSLLAQVPCGLGRYAFSPELELVCVVDPVSNIRLYDSKTGELKRSFGFLGPYSNRLGPYSWNGTQFLLCDKTKKTIHLNIWNTEPSDNQIFRGHSSHVYPVAITPDGTTTISGSYDDSVKIWNRNTGDTRVLAHNTINANTNTMYNVHDLDYDPNNKRVISITENTELWLWDAGTGHLISKKRYFSDGEMFPDILFTPDGSGLVINMHGRIYLADAASLEIVAEVIPGARIAGIAISPDGKTLAAATYTLNGDHYSLRRYNLPSLSETSMNALPNRPFCVKFAPDNQHLAIGYNSGLFELYSLDALDEPLRSIDAHAGEVFDLVFLPDGSRIFSAGRDGLIKIWATEDGKLFGTLTGHDDYVFSLAITPDGKQLVSGSGDHTVRVWEAPSFNSPHTPARHNQQKSSHHSAQDL